MLILGTQHIYNITLYRYQLIMKKIIIFLLSILFMSITSQAHSFDDSRWWKCYGEITKAHKARGLHESNRELSIRIKETVCKAYAEGEELNYEGKQ